MHPRCIPGLCCGLLDIWKHPFSEPFLGQTSVRLPLAMFASFWFDRLAFRHAFPTYFTHHIRVHSCPILLYTCTGTFLSFTETQRLLLSSFEAPVEREAVQVEEKAVSSDQAGFEASLGSEKAFQEFSKA